MKPLVEPLGNETGQLCLRANRIHAVVPIAVSNTVVIAWDAQPLNSPQVRQPMSCLATVQFPSMRLGTGLRVDLASTVLFDYSSSMVVTIGWIYAGAQSLVIHTFDAQTLRPRWRFKLPLTAAWLLRAPRVSDGFLLFLSSEHPFVGTAFTIDLKNAEIYEQDPPLASGSRHGPKRRVLPRSMYVKSLSDSRFANSQPAVPTAEGPCAAAGPPIGHQVNAGR